MTRMFGLSRNRATARSQSKSSLETGSPNAAVAISPNTCDTCSLFDRRSHLQHLQLLRELLHLNKAMLFGWTKLDDSCFAVSASRRQAVLVPSTSPTSLIMIFEAAHDRQLQWRSTCETAAALLAETAKQDIVQLRHPKKHRFVKVQQLAKQLKRLKMNVYRRVSKFARVGNGHCGIRHPSPRTLD